MDKCCKNCAYFYKISNYNLNGYCYWCLGDKEIDIREHQCCMNWIGKEINKEPYLKKYYFNKGEVECLQ